MLSGTSSLLVLPSVTIYVTSRFVSISGVCYHVDHQLTLAAHITSLTCFLLLGCEDSKSNFETEFDVIFEEDFSEKNGRGIH